MPPTNNIGGIFMSKNEEEKVTIRIYFRNGFPVSATDSDGKRYSPRKVRHSKHLRKRK